MDRALFDFTGDGAAAQDERQPVDVTPLSTEPSASYMSPVIAALVESVSIPSSKEANVTELSRVVAVPEPSPWGHARINIEAADKPGLKRIKNMIGPVIGRIIGDAYGCLRNGSDLLGIEPNPLANLIKQKVGVSPEIYDKMKNVWPAKFADAHSETWAENEDDYYSELANVVVVRHGPKIGNVGTRNKLGPIIERVIAKESHRVAIIKLGFDVKQPGTFSLFLHGKIPVPRKLMPLIEKVWPEVLAEYPAFEANKRAYYREVAALVKGCVTAPEAQADVKESWHELAGTFFTKVLKQQRCLNSSEDNIDDGFRAVIAAKRASLRDPEIWGQMLSGDKAVLPEIVYEALVALIKSFPEIARDITARRLEKQYSKGLSNQGTAAAVEVGADDEMVAQIPFYKGYGLRALCS